MMSLLVDDRFYHVLARIDCDLAETARRERCKCGGRLHSARFPRKPRGVPPHDGDDRRASFCCATCRKRTTPPSVRYLGRRVYPGAVVTLATAMQYGATRERLRRLRALLGVSRRTLARWRRWWTEVFVESGFWKAAKAAFSPPVSTSTAPMSLLERYVGDATAQLVSLLRFLAPLSTPGGYLPDRRR
jgi:hypothetical protein